MTRFKVLACSLLVFSTVLSGGSGAGQLCDADGATHVGTNGPDEIKGTQGDDTDHRARRQ